MSAEKWIPIQGAGLNYEVSDLARVRRRPGLTIKKPTIAANGYLVVGLWHNNEGVVAYVHDLVANAFLGPKPEGMAVNHISGDKLDNLPSNLRYISLPANTLHQHEIGLAMVQGEDNGKAKLTELQVIEIRARATAGDRTSVLAREFGVAPSTISQIKHRVRWQHLP